MNSSVALESEMSGMVHNSDQRIVNKLVLKTKNIAKKLLKEGSLLLEQAGQRGDNDGVR